MSDVITQTLYFAASYIGIFIAIFFGVNWLSKGWLYKFLKVKASRGKKTLIEVHGISDTYYCVGEFKSDAFKYKDRDGKERILTSIEREDIVHMMGITGLEIDGPTGTVINRGQTKTGCNPEDTDNYIKRIIEAPQIDDKWRKILMALVAITLLVAIIAAVIAYNNGQAITALQASGVIQ